MNLLEIIDIEIKDIEELVELSKDNISELDELKNQLDETEKKFKILKRNHFIQKSLIIILQF